MGSNTLASSGIDGNTTTAVTAGALLTTSGDTVFVTMDVSVTGNGSDLAITPPSTLTPDPITGVTQIGTVNPIEDTIPAGGGSVSFVYEYTITASSVTQFTFTGVPSATGETFTAGTSQGVIVTPPITYEATVTAQPDTVDPVTNIAQFQSCGLTVTSQSTEC